MSIVDKVVAAVTPPESDEARAEARAKARAAATPGSWLDMVLSHHMQIEDAFAAVRQAASAASRKSAQQQLELLLTGLSNAEEAVIYPALALHGEKAHAEKAYFEQSMTKVQLSALDDIDPMSQDYLDKLEHIRGAVAHHVYEEEGNWFLDLQQKADAALQGKLTQRYATEVQRYMGQRLAA